MPDDVFEVAPDFGPTPMSLDPWTSLWEWRPWMRELHRAGQEFALFGDEPGGKQLTDWQWTAQVVRFIAVGRSRWLGIRRDGEVRFVELDPPVIFTGGMFECVWRLAPPSAEEDGDG